MTESGRAGSAVAGVFDLTKTYRTLKTSNYDKFPFVQVENDSQSCVAGWDNVIGTLKKKLATIDGQVKVVVVECYQGVHHEEIATQLKEGLQPASWIDSCTAFKDESAVREMVYPDVTDDPTFGYMTRLRIDDYLDASRMAHLGSQIAKVKQGTVVVYGTGASRIAQQWDVLVYADMARWEIQKRMRRNEVNNLGVQNKNAEFSEKYKHGFFVDWRVCDRLKRELLGRYDFLLDTNQENAPKLVEGDAFLKGLEAAAQRPFRVVPFFDPGPWGGQWMKEVCDLDRSAPNFAWCFDCVPEENSLMLRYGNIDVEVPSINLVFYQAENLLGAKVRARFGDQFPIRFDFLDTMGGGNLSLQVHPSTEYIRETFGMQFTQDESYYILDAADDAIVYLGLHEDVNPKEMICELRQAQDGKNEFNAEKYVKTWPIRKHQHMSIPAGTVHCSATDTMVLEISATPYIFTFKLWDWARLGLDGKPRPISIDHGEKVIRWDYTTPWVEKHLLEPLELIGEGDGWKEERTGLSHLQFIETRRHWFTKKVTHNTDGMVNVLNLVQGREAIVESPEGKFDPFVVHYAETFIVPAAVGTYTIRPYGEGEGTECATIKASVRA